MTKNYATVWKNATTLKDWPALQVALHEGADPNHKSWEGLDPILFADDGWQLNLLVNAGANVNACFPCGTTLLHRVDEALSEMLLSNGANPNACDEKGNTPLHKATSAKCRVLLRHGADATLRNIEGRTAYQERNTHKHVNMDLYEELRLAERDQQAVKQKKELTKALDGFGSFSTLSREEKKTRARRM